MNTEKIAEVYRLAFARAYVSDEIPKDECDYLVSKFVSEKYIPHYVRNYLFSCGESYHEGVMYLREFV